MTASQPVFRKSSLSFANSNCVEVAGLPGGQIHVRDSKDPDGPSLVFTPAEWQAFLGGVRNGEFNHLAGGAAGFCGCCRLCGPCDCGLPAACTCTVCKCDTDCGHPRCAGGICRAEDHQNGFWVCDSPKDHPGYHRDSEQVTSWPDAASLARAAADFPDRGAAEAGL